MHSAPTPLPSNTIQPNLPGIVIWPDRGFFLVQYAICEIIQESAGGRSLHPIGPKIAIHTIGLFFSVESMARF